MSMNLASADGDEDEMNSTINTTPLVDVMLVLLIIFLITIPVVTTSIPVTLPKERNEVRETKPENIVISVDAQGRIFWNDLRIPTTNTLIDRLKKIAVLTPRIRLCRSAGGAPLRGSAEGASGVDVIISSAPTSGSSSAA